MNLTERSGVIRFSDLRNNNGVVRFNVRDNADVSKMRGRLRGELGSAVDIGVSGNAVTLSYSDAQQSEIINDALARSIEIVSSTVGSSTKTG